MRDLHDNILASVALNAAVIGSNTTTVGATIDKAGYASLEFVLQSGVLTDGAYAVAVFAGDASNMSDEVTVTATSELIGTIAGVAFALTDDNVVKRIGYKGPKRYVRLKVVSTAVTSGGILGAVAIQGHPLNAPVP